jgi:hypothetical protein
MLATECSVLDEVQHARLIADMQNVCETANVPRQFMYKSAKEYCGVREIDWIRRFPGLRAQGVGGLVMIGTPKAETRCMAIAAALVRNFIDARVMPLNTVLELKEKGALPEPSVLIIPNMYVSTVGRSLPAWKIQTLYDVLLGRLTANKPTVLYIEDMDAMTNAYGPVFREHIEEHFMQA